MSKPREVLREVASYGFGVYLADGHIIIADPQDDAEGFGVECETLEQAYSAWDEAWSLRDTGR